MINREPTRENNLFYTCSLVELISRKTNNKKSDVVNKLGKKTLSKIYDLAEVYHSENIEKVSEELIKSSNIEIGNYTYDNNIPTFFGIGRVYTRLILKLENNPQNYIKTLMEVLSSWIILKIDNYESSLYYENPDYIYECYKTGKIL